MKTSHVIILFLLLFSTALIGQSVCDQFIATMKENNRSTAKKRTFRMTSQISGDTHINYTEYDTLGRIHFWGNVGSLKIESYYANGKRYSKIQSNYIQDDEWTYQDVQINDSTTNRFSEPFRKDLQNIDCQLIGEETIKKKNYKILAYTIRKNMPKRNGLDSFLMEMNVKTWFNPVDSLVLKHEYEMTTERLAQTIKSSFEYDVPVKIDIPKNAKYEEPRKIMLAQNRTDTSKVQTASAQIPIDSSKTRTAHAEASIDSSRATDSLLTAVQLDQAPEYKEGSLALYKYISNNMHYPEEARKSGTSGTVYVSFFVEIDGKLTNIQIKRGLREDMDSEAKRIVESMSGTWKAGKINGKEVRAPYTLPLKFELQE